MSEHQGCRVCNRTDVQLKRDGTLRMHVRPDTKGSSFMTPNSGRCSGAGHPPKGVLGIYANRVLVNLRIDFKDLEDPITAEVIGEAIQRHWMRHDETFEALLDSFGNWRLKPGEKGSGRVRLSCYRINETDTDRAFTARVNAALDEISGR